MQRMIRLLAAGLVGALLSVTGASAGSNANIRMVFVSERGDALVLKKVYPACTNLDATLAPHASVTVDCTVQDGQTTGVQVRLPGYTGGVVCYPYFHVRSSTDVRASDVGDADGVFCSIVSTGGASYRVVLKALAPPIEITVRNEAGSAVYSVAGNPHCQPQGHVKLGAKDSVTYHCESEALKGRNGIRFAEMSMQYTYVCQAQWIEDRATVDRGNCSITHEGPQTSLMTIH